VCRWSIEVLVPSRPYGHTGRDLDVVVFGATGFVGRLVAHYLADNAPTGVRIGLAGRSARRLADVRAKLGRSAERWPLLVADAGDLRSVAAMAEATRVVATTVGPYLRYGTPVVEACARAGTDYADLTGEVLFVRESLDRWDQVASSTGARIVHSCGFDSVPSDLGVLLLFQRARSDGEGTLEDTRLVVTSMKGGFSGGSVDSMRVTAERVAADRRLLRVLADPYSLSPDRAAEPDVGAPSDLPRIGRDPDLGVWTGPFVMASYNTRVVRLSSALRGWAYGSGFRYQECMSYGRGAAAPVRAAATGAGLAALVAGMGFGPTRAVLDRLLPRPGEGPSEQTRRGGRFRMEISTRTSTGARYRAVVAASGDPGYQATAVMLGESALSLALDAAEDPRRAGVLTPSVGIGDPLVHRLRAAGFTLDVERL
jgi:short subunit dehydrogenase-like uncharacterized protein